MKEKLLIILMDYIGDSYKALDARSEILNLLNLSKESILCSGDDLPERRIYCADDCQIIKDILTSKGYIGAGLVDAMTLWEEYSESYCAGWLYLPEDKEIIFDCIKDYIKITHYEE